MSFIFLLIVKPLTHYTAPCTIHICMHSKLIFTQGHRNQSGQFCQCMFLKKYQLFVNDEVQLLFFTKSIFTQHCPDHDAKELWAKLKSRSLYHVATAVNQSDPFMHLYLLFLKVEAHKRVSCARLPIIYQPGITPIATSYACMVKSS